MKTLFLIPARGGSKGIPGKNIKKLGGKPLICHAIDQARALTDQENICLSTDSPEIREVAENYGLPVPFLRPAVLATDNAGSYETMIHALDYYKSQGKIYDTLVLLQPTSPFRQAHHIQEAITLFEQHPECEMVVSVKEAECNPYYAAFIENAEGYLSPIFKEKQFTRRQDCPKVYQYNGAIYIIKVPALYERSLHELTPILKYPMSEYDSLDLDTPLDWKFAEFRLQDKGLNQ